MWGSDEEKPNGSKTPSSDDQPTTTHAGLGSRGGSSKPTSTDTPLRSLDQRYDILGEAGRGGMGIVYRARDRETGEVVALKVLKPEIAADAAVIERFKNELRLARKITHKNVCRIHEFNRAADGSAYISMEFVDGESLRRILKRFGGMGLGAVVRIAQQICDGLHEAHAQGVVHRDLKPENVMIDQAGNAKVMDFGIARSLESTTLTTSVLGTPAYMAPEQAEGKPVDHRTDIYALGLILYELLTGSTAFSGETPAAVVYKQVHDTPASPRALEATIPDYIEKGILKCLEKNPSKRFQSVDELAAALARKPEARPVAAEGASEEVALSLHLASWQREDWGLLAGAAVGLVMFFVLFYRFHPASAMKITVDSKQQAQIAGDLSKKIDWNIQTGTSRLWFAPGDYYAVASGRGSALARQLLQDDKLSVAWWAAEMKVTSPDGKIENGTYRETTRGKLVGMGLSAQDDSPGSHPSPRPSPDAVAQMQDLAERGIKTLLDEDLSSVRPRQSVSWSGFVNRWIVGFAWDTPLKAEGLLRRCLARADGSRLIGLDCYLFPLELATGRIYGEPSDSVPPPRYFLALPLMMLFAFALFLVKKGYRQPRSLDHLSVAAVAAACGALAYTAIGDRFSGPGADFLNIILPMFAFIYFLLWIYAVLKTASYYLRTRFPVQAASYQLLFTRHLLASASGLSLARGILVGAAFSGVWMAVVSIGGLWGKSLTGMLFLLEGYQILARTSSSFAFSVFPALFIIEVLGVGWLLVALPLSLLGKATARSRVLLAALGALWLALGFSLAGPMVFPRVPYHLMVVAQAVFLGAIFLRYGLLSTLSAIFTIETLLLAFPLLQIFQHVDSLPYAIPIVVCFTLLASSVAICFRAHLGGAFRRVAAVFE